MHTEPGNGIDRQVQSQERDICSEHRVRPRPGKFPQTTASGGLSHWGHWQVAPWHGTGRVRLLQSRGRIFQSQDEGVRNALARAGKKAGGIHDRHVHGYWDRLYEEQAEGETILFAVALFGPARPVAVFT